MTTKLIDLPSDVIEMIQQGMPLSDRVNLLKTGTQFPDPYLKKDLRKMVLNTKTNQLFKPDLTMTQNEWDVISIMYYLYEKKLIETHLPYIAYLYTNQLLNYFFGAGTGPEQIFLYSQKCADIIKKLVQIQRKQAAKKNRQQVQWNEVSNKLRSEIDYYLITHPIMEQINVMNVSRQLNTMKNFAEEHLLSLLPQTSGGRKKSQRKRSKKKSKSKSKNKSHSKTVANKRSKMKTKRSYRKK